MLKKIPLYFLMILTISAMVNLQVLKAESYQFEGAGYYYNESSDSTKAYMYGIDATAYFKQVSVDGGPYAEAAFLQKAGFITLGGGLGNFKIEEPDGDTKIDPLFFGIDVLYVFPVPFFVKAGYERFNMEGEFKEPGWAAEFEGITNSFTGELGYYIVNGFALAATAVNENEDLKIESIPTIKTETNVFGGYIKYVTMFNSDMGANFEGSYNHISSKQEGEDKLVNNVYTVKCDFYPTQKIGLGGSVELNRGDNKESAGNTYSAMVSAFLTPNIMLSANFGIFKADEKTVDDSRTFEIMAGFRI